MHGGQNMFSKHHVSLFLHGRPNMFPKLKRWKEKGKKGWSANHSIREFEISAFDFVENLDLSENLKFGRRGEREVDRPQQLVAISTSPYVHKMTWRVPLFSTLNSHLPLLKVSHFQSSHSLLSFSEILLFKFSFSLATNKENPKIFSILFSCIISFLVLIQKSL